MFDAIFDLAELVAGGKGIWDSITGQDKAGRYASESLARTSAAQGNIGKNAEVLRDLAYKHISGGTYDQAFDVMADILEGTDPIEMDAFQNQFDQIDEVLVTELKEQDNNYRIAMQNIADEIPDGETRSNMLRELAIAQMDNRQEAIAESKRAKRDLNLKLKDEWFKYAMTTATNLPGQLLGQSTQAYSMSAPSSDAALRTSVDALKSNQANISTIGDWLDQLQGFLGGDEKTEESTTVPEVTKVSVPKTVKAPPTPIGKDLVESGTIPKTWI